MVTVRMTPLAEKQLRRVPRYIIKAFYKWVDAIETDGLIETRKIPGYHDEPLIGNRAGQRSVRLNRAYRVVYESNVENLTITVIVVKVSKHEY